MTAAATLWAATWAAYTDHPDSRPAAAVAGEQAPALEVGFLAIEFDATGQVMSDGELYLERRAAEDIVNARNALDGHDELLDRWFVLPVIADTDPVRAAVVHAAALRRGDRRDDTPEVGAA